MANSEAKRRGWMNMVRILAGEQNGLGDRFYKKWMALHRAGIAWRRVSKWFMNSGGVCISSRFYLQKAA